MTKVDDLKSQGQYEEAGKLAASLGHYRQYGCHFGMRSTRLRAIEEFYRGYDKFHEELKEQLNKIL